MDTSKLTKDQLKERNGQNFPKFKDFAYDMVKKIMGDNIMIKENKLLKEKPKEIEKKVLEILIE